MLRSIQALQEMGVSLRMPLSESLTQKTSSKEIERAKKIRDDYIKRLE